MGKFNKKAYQAYQVSCSTQYEREGQAPSLRVDSPTNDPFFLDQHHKLAHGVPELIQGHVESFSAMFVDDVCTDLHLVFTRKDGVRVTKINRLTKVE